MLGNMLRERDVQYTAIKDDATKTWRILDTWHDDLKNLSPDDEIGDDSKAVTILTEGAFIALVKEAARTGILENASFGTGEAEHEAALLDKDQEIHTLNQKILSLEEEKSAITKKVSHTEDYELKEKAMQHILKLVSIQDMANLSRDDGEKS
tara:strand:+ start:110 stop:565 length:456 start_codon:yes stop_codon:yes gene_type:complete